MAISYRNQTAQSSQSTYLSVFQNRHNNLTLRLTIAGNVTGELLDVRYELSLATLCCGAAYASTEFDRLTGDFALEGPKDKLIRDFGI